MTCQLNAWTGAYALDALDEQERAVFAEHLQTCASCDAEVRSLQSAAADLSLTAMAEPPAQLRGNVLSAISQVRPEPAPVTEPVKASAGNVVAFTPRRTNRMWPAVAAACAVVAVGASAWGLGQRHERSTTAATANRIYAVLTAADAQSVTGSFGTGHGTVINSKRLNKTILVANGIASPKPGHAYELWRVTPGGAAIPAGTFTPKNGQAITEVAGDTGSTSAISITIERAGGVAVPTTQAVLSVRL